MCSLGMLSCLGGLCLSLVLLRCFLVSVFLCSLPISSLPCFVLCYVYVPTTSPTRYPPPLSRVVSCRAVSCRVLPCFVSSCLVLSCLVSSCLISPRFVFSCRVLPLSLSLPLTLPFVVVFLVFAFVCVFAFGLPWCVSPVDMNNCQQISAQPWMEYLNEAKELHRVTPMIDGHNGIRVRARG